jgi:hypothetical protein
LLPATTVSDEPGSAVDSRVDDLGEPRMAYATTLPQRLQPGRPGVAREFRSFTETCVGRRLLRVGAATHLAGEGISPQPLGCLELHFADQPAPWRLAGDVHARSLLIGRRRTESFLDNAGALAAPLDVSGESPWPDVVGRVLRRVHLIMARPGCVIGLNLDMGQPFEVWILAFDGRLTAMPRLPQGGLGERQAIVVAASALRPSGLFDRTRDAV